MQPAWSSSFCARGMSPVMGFGDRHVVLFVSAGIGRVVIAGHPFTIDANAGAYVRPGESFRLENDGDVPFKVFAAACPRAEPIEWHDAMASNFRLPVTVILLGLAPSSTRRRADSSPCTHSRSMSPSTRRKNGRIKRYRGYDR